jgi:serine/threonine protein kinase
VESPRWDRIQALFHSVADLPAQQQLSALQTECSDQSLVDEVLAMLAQDRTAAGMLDAGVERLADQILSVPSGPAGTLKNIGVWQIGRVLGEGGMGVVFLATREDLGTVAAIKVLRDAWISPARRERFALEQRMLASLDHPNIARLLDANTLPDGTPFFVMEYVDGLPLDRHCDSQGSGTRQRLELFRSVCEAVKFAHGRAVIHRDLKPSNILVKADGTVKLLDFGIAKHLDALDPGVDLTLTGLRLLTPAYASPEQIRGEPAAVHSDVYSLGVILYQLLTGRLPFDLSTATPTEAAEILLHRDPVRPSVTAGQGGRAWSDLDVLCLTALHKDVQKRYASAEGLIRDIDQYLKGEPLEARPDTPGYRFGKFVGRHRRAVAAVSAGSLMVAALVIFFVLRLAAERDAALAASARTRRVQLFISNLFQGGDKDTGPAHDMRVSTLIERGVQEARALDRDPVTQAGLYQTLGDIYRKLGSLDQAESLLNSALERRKSLPGQNTADVAESLVSLALLRTDQARLDDAGRLANDALDLSRRTLPTDHPAVAAATDALGRILEEKGEYQQAIPVLEEAVRLRSLPSGSPADLASSLYELANVHFYAGSYKQSEALNNRVLTMSRQIYGERHPRVADALVNLGAIQQDLGNYKEAERFQRQALEITRSFYGENHYRTASGFTMVARALVYEKRFPEAVDLLHRALAIQEGVFGDMHPRVASALNELGNVAVMRGQYSDARAAFRRMIDIYAGVYAGKHYLIGTALSNLGSAYMADKDNRRAEQFLREALAMYGRTLPADHLNAAIVRIKLGRALLRQKRFAEAEVETSAGYLILKKQINPATSWMNSAQADLAQIYLALHQTEKAAEFRKEPMSDKGR